MRPVHSRRHRPVRRRGQRRIGFRAPPAALRPPLASALRAVLAVVVSASLAPALRPSPVTASPITGIRTAVRGRADSSVGIRARAAVAASGSVLRTTARGSARIADVRGRIGPQHRAADAAVTGYPTTPALAVTSERRTIAMNCIAFTVRPCAAGTCARRPSARRNMCGRTYALRERSRPRCAMCDERRRRLAPGHAFCYLCPPDDNAERAQVSRPGRLAQSPRRLQTLAAPAIQAGYGVQVGFDHPDPRRGLGSHTTRSRLPVWPKRALGMFTLRFQRHEATGACREKLSAIGSAEHSV